MKSKLKKVSLLLFMLCNLLLASNLDAGCPAGYEEQCATEIPNSQGGKKLDCGTNGDAKCCVLSGGGGER